MNGQQKFVPFANESDSIGIGELTVENRTDRVSIYGSIDFMRDREGLIGAKLLAALLDSIVSVLQAENLPDRITLQQVEEVPNPFSAADEGLGQRLWTEIHTVEGCTFIPEAVKAMPDAVVRKLAAEALPHAEKMVSILRSYI